MWTVCSSLQDSPWTMWNYTWICWHPRAQDSSLNGNWKIADAPWGLTNEGHQMGIWRVALAMGKDNESYLDNVEELNSPHGSQNGPVTNDQSPVTSHLYWTLVVFHFSVQTYSSIVSSSHLPFIDISPSLTMSENFQNPSVLGTAHSLQLPLSVVNNAASLTGSVCNYSRVSAPAGSSDWLLTSASGTSFQPLMGSAYLYQHSSTTMLSGVSGQSQISTSAASYPSLLEWDIAGSAEKKSSMGDYTVTVLDQDTAVSSMSMAARYEKPLDINNTVSVYPSLSARLVERTPSQVPNQSHSLSLPYQDGNQVYYYHQGTLGPLLSGELGPYLQSYGSMTYTGGRGSALQTYSNSSPEMVMVLKEIQPSKNRPPASTSGIYYSVSAQPITESSYQVMNTQGMESSLALQPSSQTFCLTQPSELATSCSSKIQILESNQPPELLDVPIIAPAQSNLALPPAANQEHTDNNLDEMKIGLSNSLDTYQIPIENEDPPLCPLEIPDIHQLLACIDHLSQEQQPGTETTGQGKNGLCFEESGIESGGSFADIATLVEDIHLPQLFDCLEDLDQCKDLQVETTTDTITLNQVQENSSGTKGPSHPTRKNKNEASEPLEGEPKAKIQPQVPEGLLGGAVMVCNAAVSDRCPVTMAKQKSKPQKAASSRISKTKSHGQEKTKKSRENTKKAEESKQPGSKVKAEEKPTIARMKRKKSQPELCQEAFKKPRSCLGMHMLESVQVFHALGKKNDQKPGFSSSRVLGSSKKPRDFQASSAVQPWLGATRDGKGVEKTQLKAQKPSSSAEECSSPSQYELPPPGKVKLVPLPFPTMEKPRVRPVPRRPQSLASHHPAAAHPARLGSTNSAQPSAANSSRPNTASLPGPAKPAQPISTNPSRPGLPNPPSRPIPQPATSRPAPCKTSASTSLQREPLPVSVTKRQSPPKAQSQSQFLLQDFRFQPIPWRKPNVPEPVMSKPITKEQRPEREAMKRKAQQERENAAKYTSLGKVQFFIEREKEMDISQYYGYVM
ncbi:uncharacterized protein C2orf78-like [Sorex araneus]|uniref:uncharacterized protein C2orf78-like n=1 Tax=Sorex araneus TaxID=42254 RepID=UPI0024336E37|nr:uncharacterized protein C2orf78-like [Sorex araneus]